MSDTQSSDWSMDIIHTSSATVARRICCNHNAFHRIVFFTVCNILIISIQMSLSILEIPRELRDVIWMFYVFDWAGDSKYINPGLCFPNSPAKLLRTCRQIHAEVSVHFYSSPVFYLHAPHQSSQWIEKIGVYNASSIRNLILKSSFLSMDSNGAGRILAVETWASVLRAMPNLRQLTFDHESDGPNWSSLLYKDQGSQEHSLALSSAIEDLTQLESFSYVGGRSCNLEVLSSKPKLRSLRITHAALITKSPLENLHQKLNFLKILQLGNGFERRSKWDWGSFAPTTYTLKLNKIFTSSQALWLVEDRGGSSSVSVSIRYDYRLPDHQPIGGGNLKWLLSSVPNLTYLGLECGVDSSVLEAIPPSVEYLALALTELDDAGRIAEQLRRLPTRCQLLKLLEIAVIASKGATSNALSNDSPVQRVLRTLQDAGISVQYIVNESFERNGEGIADHIDQSGLIP